MKGDKKIKEGYLLHGQDVILVFMLRKLIAPTQSLFALPKDY